MLYMVIERFRNGDPIPVYRQLRDRGRLMPEGLTYHASWISEDLVVCFQVMETEDPQLLVQWATEWKDLMDFEVLPVLTSAEVRARLAPRLNP